MLGFVPHPNLPKMPAYGDVQYIKLAYLVEYGECGKMEAFSR
jgi:hypothetical protein